VSQESSACERVYFCTLFILGRILVGFPDPKLVLICPWRNDSFGNPRTGWLLLNPQFCVTVRLVGFLLITLSPGGVGFLIPLRRAAPRRWVRAPRPPHHGEAAVESLLNAALAIQALDMCPGLANLPFGF